MSITATIARRLAVTALVLTAIAAAGIAALVGTADTAHARFDAGEPVSRSVTADPFVVALMPGTEVSPARARALLTAADRVCEGLVAEVPVVVMADSIAARFGVDDTQARHFVNLAATSHCSDL